MKARMRHLLMCGTGLKKSSEAVKRQMQGSKSLSDTERLAKLSKTIKPDCMPE